MNSYAESLSNKLKTAGLENIEQALTDLGVETVEDLKLLEEDALGELKLNYIQKKKLKVLIKEICPTNYPDQDNPTNKSTKDVQAKFPIQKADPHIPSITRRSSSTQSQASKGSRVQIPVSPPTKMSDSLISEASVPTASSPPNNLQQSPNAKPQASKGNDVKPHKPRKPLGYNIQNDCNIVSHSNNMTIYQPDMKIVYESKDVNSNFRKKVFGTPNRSPEKVILVVGATGSGKTTLINGIVNYLFSSKFKDPFRYKLMMDAQDGSGKQSESQTKWITAYTLYHREEFPFPFTLTIIDTPGFGDTRGVKRDIEITKQIKNFFSTPGHQGIDHIDAIGFVAQSCLSRLTPTQQYIFDSILSLFGKDIGGNIFLLLTFADGKKPQALAAIQEAKIPCNHWFKFNNSVLYSEVDNTKITDDDDDFDEMFWKMGTKSYRDFLHKLSIVTPKSLTLTQSVLNTRETIQATIQGLQEEIHLGLTELEKLKDEVDIVLKHKTKIEQNKDFTYTVPEDIIKHEGIPNGTYITNCLNCNRTCHYPCSIPNNSDKSGCASMSGGNCGICSGNCHWSKHVNNDFRIVTVRKIVTKDSMELKKRYQKAKGDCVSAEQIVKGILDEIQARQMNSAVMTSKVRKLLGELDVIALKPNPLSTVDYIDILIETEKSNGNPGFNERITQLREIRKEVEFINSAIKNNEDPFEKFKAKIEEDRKSQKAGVWAQVGSYLQTINFF